MRASILWRVQNDSRRFSPRLAIEEIHRGRIERSHSNVTLVCGCAEKVGLGFQRRELCEASPGNREVGFGRVAHDRPRWEQGKKVWPQTSPFRLPEQSEGDSVVQTEKQAVVGGHHETAVHEMPENHVEQPAHSAGVGSHEWRQCGQSPWQLATFVPKLPCSNSYIPWQEHGEEGVLSLLRW